MHIKCKKSMLTAHLSRRNDVKGFSGYTHIHTYSRDLQCFNTSMTVPVYNVHCTSVKSRCIVCILAGIIVLNIVARCLFVCKYFSVHIYWGNEMIQKYMVLSSYCPIFFHSAMLISSSHTHCLMLIHFKMLQWVKWAVFWG